MGLTCSIKLIRFFIFNICCFIPLQLHWCYFSISYFTALILDFQNCDCPPSCILKYSQFLSQIQIIAYFYAHTQNLVKLGQSAAELLRIFDFQNGGRPPSRIWYDVISDHPRLVFDGPNILLKLHFDRAHTLQDFAIFIFGRFGLKLPIHAPFWGVFKRYYPQMNSDIVATPKMTVLGWKHVVWAINRENLSTGSTWARGREKNTV